MRSFVQLVTFLMGVAVTVVGLVALVMGLGAGAGGSFRLIGIVEIDGRSTPVIFVLVGAFLMISAAGWFRQTAQKLAVARDLKQHIEAMRRPELFVVRAGPQDRKTVNGSAVGSLTAVAPLELSSASQKALREIGGAQAGPG